ncbi:MAG: uroporphyrinogen decarboxylase, partial [Deltaproteobacteria bacterium]
MSVFLDACRRKPTSYTPVWIMRQAGRYQPEYRALRERVSFIELCKTPDLACEVTVRAVDQLGVDAGIIFADILLILEPLQIGFEFTDDHGPKILNPIRTAVQVDAIPERIDAAGSLSYVMDAIRATRPELDVPLIGFAGAPFTLASYAIEGGGSKNYFETKKLMYGDEGLWNSLMARLSNAIADYLIAQIDAGAQAVQLFDSWVGCLAPEDYRRYVLPHQQTMLSGITPTGGMPTSNGRRTNVVPVFVSRNVNVTFQAVSAWFSSVALALAALALKRSLRPKGTFAPIFTTAGAASAHR